MRAGFSIAGMTGVEEGLEQMDEQELRRVTMGALAEGMALICQEAKALCPSDTGELQSSIEARVTESSGEVVAHAPHALYVEMGTMRSPAQPFLFPAVRAHQQEVMSRVRAAIRAYLRKVKHASAGDGEDHDKAEAP